MQHLCDAAVQQSGERATTSQSFHSVVPREPFGESLASVQTLMTFPVTLLLLEQPAEFGKLFPARSEREADVLVSLSNQGSDG